MTNNKRALFGCVFAGALGVARAADAQFLGVEIAASRSTQPAGIPSVASSSSTGATTFRYSTTGFDNRGVPVNVVVETAPSTIGSYLAVNRGVSLLPATTASTSSLRISIPDLGSAEQAVTQYSDTLDYLDRCRAGALYQALSTTPGISPTLPPGGGSISLAGNCDKLDATIRLNGVSATVSANENRIPLHVVIPSIAYDSTLTVIPPGSDGVITRSDALRAVRDDLSNSGKLTMLATQLAGKAGASGIKKGDLPTGGTLISGELTVGATTRRFGVDNPGQVLAYYLVNQGAQISDFGLSYTDGCFRGATGGVSGTCSAANAKLAILGIEVTASAPANSTDITFTVPQLDLSFTSKNAVDRGDATDQFAQYARDNISTSDLTKAYARYLAQSSPADPLVGNPYSAQGKLTRATLDLDSPSAALGETSSRGGNGRSRPDDPAGWMVGGRTGYLSSGRQDAEFVDAVLERGFRVIEGSRARLKISVPLSYIHYGSQSDGGETATFGARAALEMPIIDGRWVVEPSAAASAFYSSNNVSSGALYSVGISSRYKIAPVGRGHIVIGNAINYSSTLSIEAGDFASPKISNTAIRNGIAYQVPYGRVFGRQGTVRASYTYTHLWGDDVLVENYHEVSLSYGVGSREASVKQIGETLRFGLNGAFGHDFTAVSLTAGYRF